MASGSYYNRQMCKQLVQLKCSSHEVITRNSINDFFVKFRGPLGTSYEGGVWYVQVLLPSDFPFSAPRMKFVNKIYHPNVDEYGVVTLSMVDLVWEVFRDMEKIFDIFLPQLLSFPFLIDPANIIAAHLYKRDNSRYWSVVAEYTSQFASTIPTEIAELLAHN